MKLVIQVSHGYKTPGSLEEAARVMGGQLIELRLVEIGQGSGRGKWQATIVLPQEVVVEVDPNAGDWTPGWKRVEQDGAAPEKEEE